MSKENIRNYIKKLINSKVPEPTEILEICLLSNQIFKEESNILSLKTPLNLVGDIHGQFKDLLEMFRISGHPPYASYLFLGDYIDRGLKGIETICLLLCYKILYPKLVYFIRGNHECRAITTIYGFYAECAKKYNQKSDFDAERVLTSLNKNVWENITCVFDSIPIGAIIEADKTDLTLKPCQTEQAPTYFSHKRFVKKRVLAMHGGISPLAPTIDHIKSQFRYGEVPKEGLISDILWSDPDEMVGGFTESPRGAGYLFGKDVTETFIKTNDIDLVIRAHQLCQKGYAVHFGGKVLTVWSAPNYCGRTDNLASVLEIYENMSMSFNIFTEAPKEEGNSLNV